MRSRRCSASTDRLLRCWPMGPDSRTRGTSGGLPPKRSVPFSPSGSSAPGDVRAWRRGSGRPVVGAPRGARITFAAPAGRRPVLRPTHGPVVRGPTSRPVCALGRRTPDGPDLAAFPSGCRFEPRGSPRRGDPSRPSDLAASLPFRFPTSALPRRPVLPPTAGYRRFVRSLLPAFRPLGAMRNVPTAPRGVNPTFSQVTCRMRRSRVCEKE